MTQYGKVGSYIQPGCHGARFFGCSDSRKLIADLPGRIDACQMLRKDICQSIWHRIWKMVHVFDVDAMYMWFTIIYIYLMYVYYDIFTYTCDTCEWSYLMCYCIIICMAVLYSWIYSWVSQTNSNSHSGINAVIATLPTAVIPQFPRQNGYGVNPDSVQCDEVTGCGSECVLLWILGNKPPWVPEDL